MLWSVTSEEAAQHFMLRERDVRRHIALSHQIRHLWGGNSCSVIRCAHCEFCYAFPFVAGDGLFYSLAYDHNSYPAWKWEFQVTYDTLRDQIRPGHRLLEIGSGDGAFLRRLSGIGIDRENIVCTEFSPHGRQIIESLGIRCIGDDIRDVRFDAFIGSFDTICLFQVLEHLDRLEVLFQKLHAMLKPDGAIFMAVPNFRRAEFNETHGALLDMPPNHIGRWKRKSFEIVAAEYGFILQTHLTEPFDLFSAWKQLTHYRFLRAAQHSNSTANRIHVIKSRRLRQIVETGSMALSALWTLPTAIGMAHVMGDSQWVHFKKANS